MRPFRWLLAGFLFDMIDVRVNDFDLLPDVVGLIALAVGLNVLRRRNPRFAVAFRLVFALMIGWFVEVFAGLGAAALAVAIAVLILELIVVYEVCTGVAEMAAIRGNAELEVAATQRWKVYLGAAIASIFIFLVAVVSQGEAFAATFALLFVAQLVGAIAILGLMVDADRYFAVTA